MNNDRYILPYQTFVSVFGEPTRYDRILKIREATGLGLKEAKWLIDSCIGSLGKKTIKVVYPDGSEADVTYPMGYLEGMPFHTGETILLEMRSGGSSVQLAEDKDGLVFREDIKGNRIFTSERVLNDNVQDANERLAAAYREVNRCNDEVLKWNGIKVRMDKIKAIARDEGLID